MKIAICGSMAFAKEMLAAKSTLEVNGHKVLMPNEVEKFLDEKAVEQKWNNKGDDDICFIKEHYNKIKESDAILVLNYDKNDIKNYVGSNSLMEIGFAYVLDKKIYLLNSIPEMSCQDEIVHINPILLGGNVSKIT